MGPRLIGLFSGGKNLSDNQEVALEPEPNTARAAMPVLFVLNHGAFLRTQSKGEQSLVVSGFLLLPFRTYSSYWSRWSPGHSCPSCKCGPLCQAGPRGAPRRTEQQPRGAFWVTAKLLSFSQPRFSSREACAPKQRLQQGRGPDNQPSFTGPGPPAPSWVSHGAPMKRAGGARRGGPARPGAFFPGHCSPGLPSPTSQQTGGAFSKRGLRPPWQVPQSRPRSRCARESLEKALFVHAAQWGHPWRDVSWRTLEAGPLAGGQQGAGPGSRGGGARDARQLEAWRPVLGRAVLKNPHTRPRRSFSRLEAKSAYAFFLFFFFQLHSSVCYTNTSGLRWWVLRNRQKEKLPWNLGTSRLGFFKKKKNSLPDLN